MLAVVFGANRLSHDDRFPIPPQQTEASADRVVWSHGPDGSVRNAEEHWEKHGGEFPEFHSATEYEKGALSFVTHPPPGTLTKTNDRGDTLFYDPATNTFAVKNSRGEPLTLPITLATGEVIDAAKPREGLINMTFNLGFDAAKRPVVVYHRYDAADHSQAFIARPRSAGGWDVQTLSAWDFKWAFSGGGSIAAEVTLGAPRLTADGAFTMDYWTQKTGTGRWRIDAATLARTADLPPGPPALPAELRAPRVAGMEVQSVVSRHAGRRWVLRWETLPRNRDLPRESAPPPTELRLYELSDGDMDTSARVGS